MTATTDEALRLLRRYEPVVRLTEGELFLPSQVEGYLARATLVTDRGDAEEVLAGPGTLTPPMLAELGERHRDEPLSLRFVENPLNRREYRAWRRAGTAPTFRRSSGAAAAGLFARLVAALMRLSLLLRGKVPGGYTAAAFEQTRTADSAGGCHYYGRLLRDGGYVVLQYWLFYPMNDWRSSFGGVNDHEADWEHVSVFLADEECGPVARWVVFASHNETGPDLRRRWDDPDLEHVGDHPVVYVGAGSHSAACRPGEYLVTVAPDLPAWVQGLRRRILRILPWWNPDTAGIGIPFIDYRRGDGLSIGPDQDQPWHAHLIDDETPWVHHYRGLWGLDTGDPLGGERAPAGPRYERDGSVRRSWAQPVAWVALDGEPATLREAEALWRDRPEHLKTRLATLEDELGAAREELRQATVAARVLGRSGGSRQTEEQQCRARVEVLRDRQSALEAELEAGTPPHPVPLQDADPQAHLRNVAVPMAQDEVARSRALRVWASASSAVLFAALGAVLLVGDSGLLTPVLVMVAGMLAVEALLRRHLVALLVNVVLAVSLVALGWTVVRLLLENVRVGAGALLLVAAAYMAVQTLLDAVTHRIRPVPEQS